MKHVGVDVWQAAGTTRSFSPCWLLSLLLSWRSSDARSTVSSPPVSITPHSLSSSTSIQAHIPDPPCASPDLALRGLLTLPPAALSAIGAGDPLLGNALTDVAYFWSAAGQVGLPPPAPPTPSLPPPPHMCVVGWQSMRAEPWVVTMCVFLSLQLVWEVSAAHSVPLALALALAVCADMGGGKGDPSRVVMFSSADTSPPLPLLLRVCQPHDARVCEGLSSHAADCACMVSFAVGCGLTSRRANGCRPGGGVSPTCMWKSLQNKVPLLHPSFECSPRLHEPWVHPRGWFAFGGMDGC